MTNELIRSIAEAASEWRYEKSNVYRTLPGRDKQSCDRFARDVLELIELMGQPMHAGKALPPDPADHVQDNPVVECEPEPPPPTACRDDVLAIIRAVSEETGIPVDRILTVKNRHRKLVDARMVVSWIARECLAMPPTYKEVCTIIGTITHYSTIHHYVTHCMRRQRRVELTRAVCVRLGYLDKYEKAWSSIPTPTPTT